MARTYLLLLPVVCSMLVMGALEPMVGASAAPATVHYEVGGRGQSMDLEEFAAAAAEIYADARGWGAAGGLRFERVAAGGDFTLWLAADAVMGSFGGACGPVWSCRSGHHVVVNEDRWLGATPAWHAAGATLADYRRMVLNHETGHWLGLGHQTCSAAGQPAAVMQQQSMGLEGCAPNPWPLPTELQRAEAGWRVRSLPARDEPLVGRAQCRYTPWQMTARSCP